MEAVNGQILAQEIEAELKIEFSLQAASLAIAMVGNDPSSATYVRLKGEMGKRLGVSVFAQHFPEDALQSELLDWIKGQNQQSTVTGILVQLPLPSTFSVFDVVSAIDPLKDVDGLHPLNWGVCLYGQKSIVPAAVRAILTLLVRYQLDLSGKSVVIVGRGTLVGKPLLAALIGSGATLTVCHRQTPNLAQWTREADILISACGQPNVITGDMIKAGAVVIDAGDNRETGVTMGDVHESVASKARLLAPVPGGIGPLTVVSLYANLLDLVLRKGAISGK